MWVRARPGCLSRGSRRAAWRSRGRIKGSEKPSSCVIGARSVRGGMRSGAEVGAARWSTPTPETPYMSRSQRTFALIAREHPSLIGRYHWLEGEVDLACGIKPSACWRSSETTILQRATSRQKRAAAWCAATLPASPAGARHLRPLGILERPCHSWLTHPGALSGMCPRSGVRFGRLSLQAHPVHLPNPIEHMQGNGQKESHGSHVAQLLSLSPLDTSLLWHRGSPLG